MDCPFDFLTDFDSWWRWKVDVIVNKLTPEQATRNTELYKAGWKLVDDAKYGMWTYYGDEK